MTLEELREEVGRLHELAMLLADRAEQARRGGNAELYRSLSREAMDHESGAARLLVDELEIEPTRGVLFRSAATLALQAGEIQDAERLALLGLAGNPPAVIEEELRDVLKMVVIL